MSEEMKPLITPRPTPQPKWLRRLSRPLQLSVLERIRAAGFDGDPDEWIADVLTTAHHSPQGYVLRLGIGKKQVKVLTAEAVAEADLFNQTLPPAGE